MFPTYCQAQWLCVQNNEELPVNKRHKSEAASCIWFLQTITYWGTDYSNFSLETKNSDIILCFILHIHNGTFFLLAGETKLHSLKGRSNFTLVKIGFKFMRYKFGIESLLSKHEIFLIGINFHARLNSHYEARSYKKKRHKKIKSYRKSV